jgi:hypothetical protein
MNIVILNWQSPLWEMVYEVVKRSGRDNPIWVVIHICMETTQRISLYSCPYIKLAKTPYFYYLLWFFFSIKLEKRGWNRFCPVAGALRGGDPNNVYTCK